MDKHRDNSKFKRDICSLLTSVGSITQQLVIWCRITCLTGRWVLIALHLGQTAWQRCTVHELRIDWSNWNLKTWFETLQYTWEWIIYAAVQLQSRKWDEQSPDHYRDGLHQSLIIWACVCMCACMHFCKFTLSLCMWLTYRLLQRQPYAGIVWS